MKTWNREKKKTTAAWSFCLQQSPGSGVLRLTWLVQANLGFSLFWLTYYPLIKDLYMKKSLYLCHIPLVRRGPQRPLTLKGRVWLRAHLGYICCNILKWRCTCLLLLSIVQSEVKWSEVKSLSRVWLFATPWTLAYQDPQSMGFSRQEYWSGLPFPSPIHSPKKTTNRKCTCWISTYKAAWINFIPVILLPPCGVIAWCWKFYLHQEHLGYGHWAFSFWTILPRFVGTTNVINNWEAELWAG